MDGINNAYLFIIIAMLFLGVMQLVDALILVVGAAFFLPQINAVEAAF